MPPKSVGVSGNPAIRSVFWQREQGGRPPAAAVQEDAAALDLDRMLELRAETIEAQQRAAVEQLAECRQFWPGGVDTAARLEAAIKALAGPAGRRAAILRQGLSRAALLVCPLLLAFGYAMAPGRTSWRPGLQVGARVSFDAVVTRYVKGYTGDDPVRQAARPRELDYGLKEIQAVHGNK